MTQMVYVRETANNVEYAVFKFFLTARRLGLVSYSVRPTIVNIKQFHDKYYSSQIPATQANVLAPSVPSSVSKSTSRE